MGEGFGVFLLEKLSPFGGVRDVFARAQEHALLGVEYFIEGTFD